jgi:hypothetical protein
VMPYTVVDVSIVLEEPGATIFRVPWTAGSSETLVNTYQTYSIITYKAVIFMVTTRA